MYTHMVLHCIHPIIDPSPWYGLAIGDGGGPRQPHPNEESEHKGHRDTEGLAQHLEEPRRFRTAKKVGAANGKP